MIKRFLLTIVFVLILAAIVGLFLPNDLKGSHSITINAPVSKVHAYIGDLKTWPEWGPWEEKADYNYTTSPNSTGLGATQSWTGDRGDGSLTFTKVSPLEGIEYDLFFGSDKANKSLGKFEYKIQGDVTQVTWSMEGKMDVPVIGGYIALMCQSELDNMFTKGLENIKNNIEAKK